MRLYLDACSIIYAIEGLPSFRSAVLQSISQVEATPAGVLMTSSLSRLECRVKPLRDSDLQLLDRYDQFFSQTLIQVVEIRSAVIERATSLRAVHGFKTPDAIHLATAIEERAELFLTGDAALTRCPDIRVEVLKG
jgi:predicted nucleic acid-binding protein